MLRLDETLDKAIVYAADSQTNLSVVSCNFSRDIS